jgi:integrase
MSKCSVEIRANSIRLRFTLDGVPQRPTLRDDETGRPLTPDAGNVKYATRLAAEIERKMAAGVLNISEYFPEMSSETTLAEHLDVWFATAQRLAPSTLKSYCSAINFWKSELGDQALRGLTVTGIRTALASRAGLNGKTVNNYVSVLNTALALALEEGLVDANKAAEIGYEKWQRKPPDPFSKVEVEAIVNYAREHWPGPIHSMVEAWFFTGLRTGEVFGMRWISVDLVSGYAEVSESTVLGEHQESTKTGITRNVMLNSRALAAFKRQSDHRSGVEFVWFDPRSGAPWVDERAFRRIYWEPMLDALGIRYRRPYCMRHTYATMMLMAGRTPAWCAKQLGHSIEMFLGTYSKWLEGDQDAREVAGLERWLAA